MRPQISLERFWHFECFGWLTREKHLKNRTSRTSKKSIYDSAVSSEIVLYKIVAVV